MRLVIFTAHYPYGSGEVFLENELRAAEAEFDEIVIVSNSKATEQISRYIPENARVVLLRKDKNVFLQYVYMLRALFLPKYWRELVVGCRERGWRHISRIALKLMRTERGFIFLKKSENDWKCTNSAEKLENTLFYSYWLEPTVLYLKCHHIDAYRAFISRTHGGDCFFDRGYVPWRTEILDALDAVFPISEMGREDIIVHYGDKIPNLADKIQTARLGVKLPQVPGPEPVSKDPALIVSCSNVIRLKRLDLLIEALQHWNNGPLHWIHFGDGVMLEEIRSLAREKLEGIPSITWEFRGRVTNEAILDFYRSTPVTLFVNCSDVEGIPVSAMEAMAYGIPVVAREVGGNAELVNNECGALLPPKASAEALICAIRSIISEQSNQSYLKMRQVARSRVKKYYAATINYELFWKMAKGIVKHD